jgi:hypothetical protein
MPDWVFIGQLLRVNDMAFSHAQLKNLFRLKKKKKKKNIKKKKKKKRDYLVKLNGVF